MGHLVGVMGDLGTGIFEGGDGGVISADPGVRAEAGPDPGPRGLARRAPYRRFIAADPGGDQMLGALDAAAAAGGRIIGQTHCRGIPVLLSFKTRLPIRCAARVGAGAGPALTEQRRASATRRRASGWSGRPGRATTVVGGASAPGPATRLRGDPSLSRGSAPQPHGHRGGRRRGVHPAEVMIDLALETGFEQLFIQPSLLPDDEAVL